MVGPQLGHEVVLSTLGESKDRAPHGSSSPSRIRVLTRHRLLATVSKHEVSSSGAGLKRHLPEAA